jgi:hypothetical protein
MILLDLKTFQRCRQDTRPSLSSDSGIRYTIWINQWYTFHRVANLDAFQNGSRDPCDIGQLPRTENTRLMRDAVDCLSLLLYLEQ